MAFKNLNQFIDAIGERLFSYENAHMDKLLTELVEANNAKKGIVSLGVLLQGKKFVPTAYGKLTSLQSVRITSLHLMLMDQGNDFLRDANQAEVDKAQIKQLLFKLLNPCDTPQEIRNALPECIVELMPEFTKFPRTEEPGFTIVNDVRAMKQWNDLLPKISLFAMSKFIY